MVIGSKAEADIHEKTMTQRAVSIRITPNENALAQVAHFTTHTSEANAPGSNRSTRCPLFTQSDNNVDTFLTMTGFMVFISSITSPKF